VDTLLIHYWEDGRIYMPGRHRHNKPCHDTVMYKSGLFSIISESISSQSCFCNTDLEL